MMDDLGSNSLAISGYPILSHVAARSLDFWHRETYEDDFLEDRNVAFNGIESMSSKMSRNKSILSIKSVGLVSYCPVAIRMTWRCLRGTIVLQKGSN